MGGISIDTVQNPVTLYQQAMQVKTERRVFIYAQHDRVVSGTGTKSKHTLSDKVKSRHAARSRSIQ